MERVSRALVVQWYANQSEMFIRINRHAFCRDFIFVLWYKLKTINDDDDVKDDELYTTDVQILLELFSS